MRIYFYDLFPATEKSHGHANSLVKCTHTWTLGCNMQTNGDGGPTETTRRSNLKEKVFKAVDPTVVDLVGRREHTALIVPARHEGLFRSGFHSCGSAPHSSCGAHTATCGTWLKEPHKPQGPGGACPNSVNT